MWRLVVLIDRGEGPRGPGAAYGWRCVGLWGREVARAGSDDDNNNDDEEGGLRGALPRNLNRRRASKTRLKKKWTRCGLVVVSIGLML